MDVLEPAAWLEANGAQRDVIDGLRGLLHEEADASPLARWERLWRDCPRGDWMLGIAARLGVDRKRLVDAAAGCAETVLDQAESPLAADVVGLARRWARDDIDAALLRERTRALEAAPASGPAPDAAHRAALAVGLGVDDGEVLAAAASSAAEATIFLTIDCGMPLALGYAHAKTAEAVRAAVPFPVVAARLAETRPGLT